MSAKNTKNPRTTATVDPEGTTAHIEAKPAGNTAGQATLLASLTIASPRTFPPRTIPCTWSGVYGTRQSFLRSPPMMKSQTLAISYPTALSLAGRLPACNRGGSTQRVPPEAALCRPPVGQLWARRPRAAVPHLLIPTTVVNTGRNLAVAP